MGPWDALVSGYVLLHLHHRHEKNMPELAAGPRRGVIPGQNAGQS